MHKQIIKRLEKRLKVIKAISPTQEILDEIKKIELEIAYLQQWVKVY